jgi:predicted amidophosphoribosyltransferase
LIKIQKPINIKEYQYISFVPSKSIYNWCNTEELAKELAAVLNINLIKIIERINDLEKHYTSIPSLPITHNQKLIIVDDLYTTGQTIANIKNALEKYYFSEILVITLGKTDDRVYEYYY